MNDYNFGNFVCELREAKGLTQADIANELGVTPAAVSKWENGSSKPRVEVLFRLAEILGVRPEELMAGKRLGEALDPEAVKRINERYEYLCKIDSYATTSVKFRRVAAWLIDWNITGLFTSMLYSILMFIVISLNITVTKDPFVFAMAFLTILTYPVLFILRDLIFGGRSLGKRLLGLTVIDRRTAGKTNRKQRVIRNIFSVLLMQIDIVVMLVRGQSIGDTLAHTAVVLKKDVDSFRSDNVKEEEEEAPPKAKQASYMKKFDSSRDIVAEARAKCAGEPEQSEIGKINAYKAPAPATQRTILITAIAVLLAFIIFFVSLALSLSYSLGKEKETPEYRMAYSYLINSNTFNESGKSEKDIFFNSHSYRTVTDADGKTSYTQEFGFRLGFWRSLPVVCHKDGGEWYVCEECTKFD
ncbi:MAG: helix-turn-helix domain-containing protein [Clostridia bacterium]|nr:helix-turn-helix domain-containing protein [Clostridia bacterium]